MVHSSPRCSLGGQSYTGSCRITCLGLICPRSFADRLRKVATPNCQRRFYQTNVVYADAVQMEAEYRASGKAVDLEHYHYVRRGNSGVLSCFALMEPALGIDLPDEVVEHPAFKEITVIGMDLVCWANVRYIAKKCLRCANLSHVPCFTFHQDLYSFNMERSREIDASNIITILMEHKGYTLQQAVDHVGEAFADLVQRLLEARRNFPSFGPEVDSAVGKFIDAIEAWEVGNLDWSFASKRYFGEASEDIRKSRIVKLYPRKSELQQHNKDTVTPDQMPEPTRA